MQKEKQIPFGEAKIYINEQRHEVRSDQTWLKSTLSYGDFHNLHKSAFGKLRHVNEWGGTGHKNHNIIAVTNAIWVLIPLANGVEFSIADKKKYDIEVGQLLLIEINVGDQVNITPKDTAEHRFVKFVFDATKDTMINEGLFVLPLEGNKNTMNTVEGWENLPFHLHIGAYYTKEESEMHWIDPKNTFSFVVDGCFEVEKRLLFAGDALAISNTRQMEIECLSATGILLVLEMLLE